MEASMATRKQSNLREPEAAEQERRRDQPAVDAPGTVPHPGEGIEPTGSQPPEDGGVEQHPIHDSDVEDLGPEDFEELTNEVQKTGIKTDS
jgi:hypothetical protein